MNESYFSNLSSAEEFVLKCDIAGISVKKGLRSLHDVKEVKSSIGKVKYTGIGGRLAFFLDGKLVEDSSSLEIEGDLDCSNMSLTSFDGFPKDIKGNLKCAYNDFVSLDRMPSCSQLDASAFCGCEKLNVVSIPSSVTSISSYAFYKCKRLKSVTMPSSVTSIGCEAFAWSRELKSVTIPSSVTYIGYLAFSGCSGLESVMIPSSVTSIGPSAFYGCSKLSLKFENPNFKSLENYPWVLKEEQISVV